MPLSLYGSFNMITTPNMNLPSPQAGIDSGPAYAIDNASCFTLIDQHNHSAGQGVQIAPNGLNINSDLSFQNNNATNLRSSRYTPQPSVFTAPLDIGCVYVVGNELYYNDVSGSHQIQLTSNGSVNSGAGSITGLPSGTASASYSAGTFTWQAATATPANMDFGSAILRNNVVNSHGLTLEPPAAMGTDFSLVLPEVPSATSFVTLDNSGNFGASIATVGGITPQARSASVMGVSTSSGAGSTSSTTYVTVFSTTTIACTGRPMLIGLCPDGSANAMNIVANAGGNIRILLDGSSSIAVWDVGTGQNAVGPLFYTPAAGNHTFEVQIKTNSSTMQFQYVIVYAVEQ